MTSVSDIPRARATQRLASLAVYGAGPIAIVAFWWLRSTGVIARTPVAVVAVFLALTAVANLVTSVWLRNKPNSPLRVHARVAASVLTTAAVVYACGWGSLLLIAFAVGSAELLRTAGPVAIRPNLAWNCVAILLGEIAIQLRWAPTVVEPRLAHAVAITGAICLVIVTKVLGESVEATEAAESAVRDRAIHFEALIEHATDLIGVVSRDGTIISASPAVKPMLGFDPTDVAGRPVSMFLDPALSDDIGELLDRVADHAGEVTTLELRLRHRDRSERLVIATLTRPSDDGSDHIIANVHDITTQRDLEERLRHDAMHDALTGLLNRKAFGESSGRACVRAARHGRTVGMLYIDLDGFKQINDSFGHDAGDLVLIEAAARLTRCLGTGQTLARLGGDEFAVLLDAVDDDQAIRTAERILDALGQPIVGLPDDTRVGASIGIALRSSEGIEISTLMQDADAAMYAAKRNGRSRWELNASAIAEPYQ